MLWLTHILLERNWMRSTLRDMVGLSSILHASSFGPSKCPDEEYRFTKFSDGVQEQDIGKMAFCLAPKRLRY
jgi:hypothetical protein